MAKALQKEPIRAEKKRLGRGGKGGVRVFFGGESARARFVLVKGGDSEEEAGARARPQGRLSAPAREYVGTRALLSVV